MATKNFTDKQVKELDIASQRKTSGEATDTDVSNLDYAKSRGYSPTPKTPQSEMADALSDESKKDTPMIDLENLKTGQQVSVSQKDWTTNESYQGGDWTEAGAGGAGAGGAGTGGGEDTGVDAGAGVSDYLSGDKGIDEFINEAFGEVPQVEVEGLADEKLRLQEQKEEQLNALEASYTQNLTDLKRKNKDIGNELKARLMKLGVSPSDSAWSNAIAGQVERDRQAEARLRNEYNSNRVKIQSEINSSLTNLAVTENQQKFNAQVQNINSLLQRQGQGINLFSIFSQRDEAQKTREQNAYSNLMDYQAKMATLDENRKENVAQNILENAQEGYYNVQDENTVKMLASLEEQYPGYLNGITGIATQGLSDRLADMAGKEMDINYKQALIDQARANIAKTRADSSGDEGGLSDEEEAFYDDVENQLDKLASGDTDWGTAFNTVKTKYGAPDNLIDSLLNKDLWAEPFAYEEQQKRRNQDAPPTYTIRTN